MNKAENTEKQVMAWYQQNWNGRVLPLFRKPKLTLDTTLSSGKYPWSKDDAEEILNDYFSRFQVEKNGFVFEKYWPNEEVVMPLNFLRSKENKWAWKEPENLTLNMLVESAKTGRWLYD